MARKTRLGRGLDSLYMDNLDSADDKQVDNSGGNGDIKTVRISLVEPNSNQPRRQFDDEKLGELADSISEHGVLQPILVRPLENGGYQIVAGERRWRASRLAGLTEVPVIIKDFDDLKVMQIALIENIQRQDLTPIEEAEAYKNLIDNYHMTQQEVAKAVGKSRSAIANFLRLLALTDDVRQYVSEGKLSMGHAKVLAGISDEDTQTTAAEIAVENGFSVRELEHCIAEMKENAHDDQKKFTVTIKENSFKAENPYLKEFEIFMNSNSQVKTKARPCKNGDAKIEFILHKGMDFEKLLNQIGEILSKAED